MEDSYSKREEVIFGPQHVICEKHFTPDCYEDNTIIINGERVQLPTPKRLKKDAVPSIFVGSHSKPTQKAKKRKSPSKRKSPVKRKSPLKRKINTVDQNIKRKKQEKELESQTLSADESNTSTDGVDDNNISAADADEERNCPAFETILANIDTLCLPPHWTQLYHDQEKKQLSLSKMEIVANSNPKALITLQVKAENGKITVATIVANKTVTDSSVCTNDIIPDVQALQSYIIDLDTNFKLCIGADNKELRDDTCTLLLNKKLKFARCVACNKLKRRMAADRSYTKKKAKRMKKKQSSMRLRLLEKSTSEKKLKKKVAQLEMRLICAEKEIEDLKANSAFNNLPPEQKVVVEECLLNAKRSPKGRRYSAQWMYECLLMRIRSPQLYRHIQKRNILPLPSMSTINKQLKNMPSAYGFLDTTFRVLKSKSSLFEKTFEKRGVLLVDEMKLTADTKFNVSKHEFEGFVDLGKYTPEHQKGVLGDHGLVFMFQPFVGKWTQPIGCFLSKNNVNGDILAKLCLEAINKLENSGYLVDAICSDGASWNRKMWDIFEIDNNKGSCIHPIAPTTRRLGFLSDPPHLVKCARTFVINAKEFQIPEGTVKLDHWKAVIKDDHEPMALNISKDKISLAHLTNENFVKMNVKVAFQFFGNSVQAAISTLADTKIKEYPELKDCGPTIAFIKKWNRLIDILNSKTRKEALHRHDKKKDVAFLEDFLIWMDLWDEMHDPTKPHLSASTRRGLRVTIRATIELFNMLMREHSDFNFLMTDRLNQDALENFFGLLRSKGGLNDHPDASMFANLYRLMSVYALVRPPRGSNVSGGKIFETLISYDDMTSDERKNNKSKEEIFSKIEAIMNKDEFDPSAKLELTKEELEGVVEGYMAGYVARIAKQRWCKNCADCYNTLVTSTPSSENYNRLIENTSYGFLLYPTEKLFKLIFSLEKEILAVLKKGLCSRTLYDVMDALLNSKLILPRVGCKNHFTLMTQQILYFYATTRMYFASRVEKRLNKSRVTAKRLSKQSKLVTKDSKAATKKTNQTKLAPVIAKTARATASQATFTPSQNEEMDWLDGLDEADLMEIDSMY